MKQAPSATAHPIRAAILELLDGDEMTIPELWRDLPEDATAIVELLLIRSKLSCTTASTSRPDPAVRTTVRFKTSSARALKDSPRRRSSVSECFIAAFGGMGTRIAFFPQTRPL